MYISSKDLRPADEQFLCPLVSTSVTVIIYTFNSSILGFYINVLDKR